MSPVNTATVLTFNQLQNAHDITFEQAIAELSSKGYRFSKKYPPRLIQMSPDAAEGYGWDKAYFCQTLRVKNSYGVNQKMYLAVFLQGNQWGYYYTLIDHTCASGPPADHSL